eukprot:CAMPEP_0184646384 /NCGR_PEP_ID=MMETSP0308-20130426/3086_1 /TAXON_ID=38269 /ORGANISM="Gloeochaete witrockiana, Strain SAG 46.84" /LENGTH=962 /DNA_ID=CAMNT_0027076361 /DNA_START=108 /DNA_END=2996 /DNA_ORIENTATION=-
MSLDKNCTVLIHYDRPQFSATEIKKTLEEGNTAAKIATMKKVVLLSLNGESFSNLLITIIRFVVPVGDNSLKKLLLLYFEIVEKTSPDGKLLPEMILVCNALRNDLNHPNEYIRGCTLRFLCKLHEAELLEPLVPSIRLNMEHRNAYVRRNAVLAIYSIYKSFDQLCPDAPDLVDKLLRSEADVGAKRNAFLMLMNTAQDRAVEYLSTTLDQVTSFGDILQLVIVEVIRRVCRTSPTEKFKYLKCIFNLLNATSPAVVYECANTLVALSSSSTAIRAAATAYCQLLANESDNNIKLIVLDRLLELKNNHGPVLQEVLMDILKTLTSPNMDIRKKTLDIALELINPRNIEEVVLFLKKEVMKTQSSKETSGEYRQMLIQAIHSCAVKFPDVANSVVHLLMDFLGDINAASAVDVIFFVREIVETYHKLRETVIPRLLDCFPTIKSSRVFRCSLWILGEHCEGASEIASAINTIKASVGDLPLAPLDKKSDEKTTSGTPAPSTSGASAPKKSLVLSDGTYATQSATSSDNAVVGADGLTDASTPNLRALLLSGDFFLASVVSATLAKLVLREKNLKSVDTITWNTHQADALLIMLAILRLGKSSVASHSIDPDSHERIISCVRVLIEPSDFATDIFLQKCRSSFAKMLAEKQAKVPDDIKEKAKKQSQQADDLISFRQLRGKRPGAEIALEDDDARDLEKATGAEERQEDSSRKLNRVLQLTGFSDSVYAEAYVTVHQYDIVLDVLVVNQTADTLQNLCMELATMGDLKLCERPQNYTLGPFDTKQIKANIKVSSTETGVIFGNIVYDVAGAGAADRNCVVLNDIHIDIMDYIAPATCGDTQFRSMWAEFEWENKVAVNTSITEVDQFLQHIVKSTNMSCLTPVSPTDGVCAFLAANLYAKSIFGEDALVNVSVEKQPDGKLAGYIRIRSKTQGIALALGDKIGLKQKGSAAAAAAAATASAGA